MKTSENTGKVLRKPLIDKELNLSAEQMAEELGCSLSALYTRVHRKHLPAPKKLFGKLVFNRIEVEKWLAKKGLAINV